MQESRAEGKIALQGEAMKIEKKHFIIAALGAVAALLLSLILSRRCWVSLTDEEPEVIDV